MKELQYLEEQQINPLLIQEVEKFRIQYPVAEAVKNRVVKPPIPFYGKEILEMAIAFREKMYCFQAPRLRERISWRKIWPGFSAAPPTISLLM